VGLKIWRFDGETRERQLKGRSEPTAGDRLAHRWRRRLSRSPKKNLALSRASSRPARDNE
jgi:hypothetical protein